MPDVGVELRFLGVAPPLDLDAAEHGIPLGRGFGGDAVEIPVRQFGGEVGAGTIKAGIGDRDLHQQRVLRFAEIHDGLAGFPIADRLERFFKLHDEVNLERLRPAHRRAHRETPLHRGVAIGRLRGDIEHFTLHERPRQIQHDARGCSFRIRVAVEADTRGGGELGSDAMGLQEHLVIAGADDFAIVGKLRGILGDIGFAGDGHHREAGELPAMDVAETPDRVVIVAVAGIPVPLGLGVRAEVDHAEGAAGGVEVEPARLDGVDLRLHPIDGTVFRQCGNDYQE